MKVTERCLSEKALEERDYSDAYSISIKTNEDSSSFTVCDGEPEDNTLSRNFNSCYTIISLLRIAHKAGKNGEDFEVESIEVEDI